MEEKEQEGWWVEGVKMDGWREEKRCSNELLTSFAPLSGRWAK